MSQLNESPRLIHGLAALTRPIFQSLDYSQTVDALYARIEQNDRDPAALLDLGTLHQLLQLQADGLAIQREALGLAQHFTVRKVASEIAPLKLLALLQPGTFQENTPIEFLVEGLPVQLELLYIRTDAPFPETVPEHDVMLVAIGYSEASRDLLERMVPWVADWPKPVINRPEAILNTSREALKRLLDDSGGVFIAGITRLDRASVGAIAIGNAALETFLPGCQFPILIRPLDSHAGRDLEKIDAAAGLDAYLAAVDHQTFFITEFIDYRQPDGLFRKLRVVLIGGKAHIAHMAMNDHWMIHYLNAGMAQDAGKRQMEANGMASFHEGFAKRHAAAFEAMHSQLGLDYLVMDCGETPDGRLFVFEADTIMIVHDMDPEDVYPYKKPVMKQLFEAFGEYLKSRLSSSTTS